MLESILRQTDPALAEVLALEDNRQKDNLEMIASESVQPSMMLALAGSIFNNKTAVGNPGKQRLKGSQYIDRLERLANERACALFGADHAVMTTYSGSVANYCAFSALLDLGDRVLSMDPAAGAHQTHGGKNNISSRMYDFRYFGLHPETMLIDYEEAERITREWKPKLMVVGSAAYSRNIDYERLADIAHRNGAYFMTDIAHFTGLLAAGLTNDPIPHADIVTASTTKTLCGPHSGFIMCKKEFAEAVNNSVYPGVVASLHLQTLAAMTYALQNAQTPAFHQLMKNVVHNASYLCDGLKKRGFDIVTGGTDCHMFIADLRPLGTDCEKLADVMQDVGITVNTKAIPFDDSPAPRGLRAGSTVLTQRGFTEEALDRICDIWYDLATNTDDASTIQKCKKQVAELAKAFPLPEE